MHKLFFFLVFLSTLTSQAQVNRIDEQGRKQGEWKKYYDNDQLRYKGRFVDDVPVGTFTYYYENGKKMAVNHYRGNQGIAMSKQYNEKGVLIAAGKYVGQQRDSIWRIYTDKGIFVAEEAYVNGVPNMAPGLPIMKMVLLPNELIMLTEKRKVSGYRNIRTVKQKPKAHMQTDRCKASAAISIKMANQPPAVPTTKA
jgi:hypothetical protein